MCGGLSFCSSCTNRQVREWANGQTHTVPAQFVCGPSNRYDRNFRDGAYRIREHNFMQLLMAGASEVMAWPEAGKIAQELGLNQLTLVDVIRQMPQPTYLREPPKHAPASKRRRHAHAMERWRNDRYRVMRALKSFISTYFTPRHTGLPLAA